MGSVISIRIPPEIKREMDKLKSEVNWSEEIREFIKRRINEYKKKKALQEVVAYIQTLPTAPKGTAQKLVREDRDSHWLFNILKVLMKEEGWEKIIPYLNPRLEPHAIDILTAETMNVIWKYMRKYRLITRE